MQIYEFAMNISEALQSFGMFMYDIAMFPVVQVLPGGVFKLVQGVPFIESKTLIELFASKEFFMTLIGLLLIKRLVPLA